MLSCRKYRYKEHSSRSIPDLQGIPLNPSRSIQDLQGTLLIFNTRSTRNTPHVQCKIYKEHSSDLIQDLQGTLLSSNTRYTRNTPHIQYKIYKEHSSDPVQDLQGTLLRSNTRYTRNTPHIQYKIYKEHSSWCSSLHPPPPPPGHTHTPKINFYKEYRDTKIGIRAQKNWHTGSTCVKSLPEKITIH